jgi:hypothetical protein
MAESMAPFEETAHKYPDVPRFVILKLDLYRRGIVYSDRVMEERGQALPGPLILRDGTTVLQFPGDNQLEPYRIDFVDGRMGIFYGEEYVDDIEFSPDPEFYEKTTSRGTPMALVAYARPQRLDFLAHRFCHFWESGNQCKFCFWNTMFKSMTGLTGEVDPDPKDISETLKEALREPGRFSQITITGGADPRGDKPFDFETEHYIKVLQAIGENFSGRRFPSQLLPVALSRKQLKRIYDETGILSYCPDIEVWDKRLFSWICPGKEKAVGWDKWVRSMLDAVDIFGPGNVYTNFVAGCEMAEPHGFQTVDEALKSNFEGCEYLAKHGVAMMSLVWKPAAGSLFHKQKQPPLDYYVRLVKGLHDIRAAYGTAVTMGIAIYAGLIERA